MSRRPLVALLFSAWLPGLAVAEDNYVRPSEARIRADIRYLADDLREGRGVGTRGIDDAADHIAATFRELGLTTAPGAEGYFQPFTIRGESRVGEPTSLTFELAGGEKIDATLSESFSPLQVGGEGSFEDASVIFAGFGITAEKEGYDDYAGLDVKDRVVLILRREPQPDDSEGPFGGREATTYATFTAKAVNAASHGAKAVLMVNDQDSAETTDTLLDYSATPRGAAIPFMMITRNLADGLLKAAGEPSLADLEAKINRTVKPQSRELDGVKASGEVTVDRGEVAVKNVIGVLEGEGPLADETIVVGAHYDHLGRGGVGSLAFGSRDIHNGADDNASGTSTVVELARRLARRGDKLPRRVVFMLFSAEERGLLGSQHYVDHPLYPLDKTVAMVNFDMVGRLNDDRELTVFGAGTSDGLDELVEALASSQGLKPKLIEGTRGEFNQSDHASFFRKDIPVLFFFTGTHADYHKPSDDYPKINYEGMVRIADLGELILLDLARRPSRPLFLKSTGSDRPSVGAANVGSGVYFGSRPAYAYDGEGVKLDGVTEGSPAEAAGLKEGDIVIEFGGLKVTDVETYMAAMGTKKPGDEVEVVVLRGGERKSLKAKLGARPTRGRND